MHTMIYVHAPSNVTIRASDARDTKVAFARYNHAFRPALGTHALEPGIYMIQSARPIEVSIQSVDVVTLGNDKDDWPDPKANVIALEPGASVASIRDYFQLAKDASPGG